MSRTESEICIAVPAYEPWRPVAEDLIVAFGIPGNPKDPSTSLDSAWGIYEKPMLGPLFFYGFIDVTPITPDERTTLQETLGTEITDPVKQKIDNAIQQLTTHLAPEGQIAKLGPI